ncbi:MAG: response regulator [Myxococcales bacterium]
MAAGKGEDTALGTAQSRFIESLPRKAIELRGAIALLTATPAAEGPREDMRRRLHTLYASAVVFRNEPLSQAVKEGIERLDAAREEGRPLSAPDLEVLAKLVRRIPELRGEPIEPSPGSTTAESPRNGASLAAPASTGQASAPSGVSTAPAAGAASTQDDFVLSRPRSLRATLTSAVPPARVEELAPVPATSAVPAAAPTSSASATPGSSSVALALAGEGVAALATSEQRPLLQRVLSVLVLVSPGERKTLTGLLRSECVEASFVDTARQALESARDSAPDVVVADEGLASAGKLLEGLRTDPLTDFVPVVLLAAATPELASPAATEGADAKLSRPFESRRILRALGRVTGTLVETTSGLVAFGDATVGEVAERVAEEIRRGLVDAIEAGRETRVPLGEGAEVLAAAWAAVARVRAFVTEQSAGRVRFTELPSRNTPALLSVGTRSEREAQAELGAQGTHGELSGRRIVVVDDDASVVEFFAGILLEQGATVVTAHRGEEALRAARRERPDLVISDVLMPDLDGFVLCRKLKRDPVLADVPVILISWKDDLLTRLRDLSAGASGYLKKEASWQQVLSAVTEALAARATLEAQLGGPSEVRGNLEGTGVVSLLRSVRRTRPDARVTLRDAWNLFECELREGRLAQLTRTASDGSFVRGEAALPQLLGASAGRYTVTVARGTLKQTFEGSLDQVLTRGALELGSQLDALSFPLLGRVARVVFDEDAYPALLNQSPAGMRQVVERLHAGEPPLKVAQRGELAQATLEAILLDMGRRGAIRGVVGSAGEDLFAEARVTRGKEQPIELSSPFSMPPPRMAELELDEPLGELAAMPHIPPAPALPTLGLEPEGVEREPDPRELASEPPPEPPRTAPPPVFDPVLSTPAPAFEPEPELLRTSPVPAPLERRDSGVPPQPVAPVVSERAHAPAPVAARVSVGPRTSAPSTPRASGSAEPRPVGASSDRRAALPPTEIPHEADLAAAEARRSRSTLAAWAVALLALFAAAFFAERLLEPQESTRVEVIGGGPSSATGTGVPAQAPGAPSSSATPPKPTSSAAASASAALVVPQDSGFQIYNGILEPGLVTSPTQGLVVVEGGAQLAGAELSVDQHVVGTVPAKVPLSEGIHELAIRRGDAVSYRFVSVRPGKTWVLRAL